MMITNNSNNKNIKIKLIIKIIMIIVIIHNIFSIAVSNIILTRVECNPKPPAHESYSLTHGLNNISRSCYKLTLRTAAQDL